jgi:hypothetical protein
VHKHEDNWEHTEQGVTADKDSSSNSDVSHRFNNTSEKKKYSADFWYDVKAQLAQDNIYW